MKSLFDYYSEQSESYYGINYNVEDLFLSDFKTSQSRCENFLHNHYMRGRKKELLDSIFYEQYEKCGKHTHSASLDLLGQASMRLFENYLASKFALFLPNYTHWHNEKRDYLYTWYLPSMYHDFASCIELGSIYPNDSESRRSLCFHLGNHNIQYVPYRSFPYKAHNVPFRFSPELISNYFYYRACCGDCDHGIIAGYLFFDRFIKNFLLKTENCLCTNFDENGNVEVDNLNWNTDFPMYAAYVADAIICHNIWLGGKTEKETYTQYGLTSLVYTEHPESKLSVEAFPLQFMLCLLDTIEPIKRFKDTISPREILQGIKLDYTADDEIIISWEADIEQQKGFGQWKDGIIDVQNWMCIRVAGKDNHVRITFY